jgi:hypothetical protein
MSRACLAVSIGGLVLGVLDQSDYSREEVKDKSASHESKKVRPIQEKESFRRRGLTSDELFAKAKSLNEPLLIRIVDEIRKKRCQGRVKTRILRDSRSGRR